MGDYILVYGKSENSFILGLPLSRQQVEQYNRKDRNGRFLTERLRQHGVAERREDVPSLYFPIFYNKREDKISTSPRKGYTIKILPILPEGGDGRWIWSKEKVEKDKDFIEIRQVKRNGGYIYDAFFKKYLKKDTRAKLPSIWQENDFRTEIGTKELKEIFGRSKVFPYPKPVNTILRIIAASTTSSDIILDSFAGSGTTAHAVLEQNAKDNGNRKFILVEMESYANRITAERVRRVIKRGKLKAGFTYYKLGVPIDADSILSGKLPSYKEFARYVFYLATGKNHPDEKKIKEIDYFVGRSGDESVHLLYKNDLNVLRTLAITLEWATKINKRNKGKKVVYAPACFLDDETLTKFNIQFVSIPYNLFERK